MLQTAVNKNKEHSKDTKLIITDVSNAWCNLHNAGCIIQVAGHVSWPTAAWQYQEAAPHKKANISVSRGYANCWYVRTAVPVERTCHRISRSIS